MDLLLRENRKALLSIQEKRFLSMMEVSLWGRPLLEEDGMCPAIPMQMLEIQRTPPDCLEPVQRRLMRTA
jgi:hypothetical protein